MIEISLGKLVLLALVALIVLLILDLRMTNAIPPGFVEEFTDTVNKPNIVSISWGGPESSWTAQAMKALDAACQSAAALGITITVAAGDNGSTDGSGKVNIATYGRGLGGPRNYSL